MTRDPPSTVAGVGLGPPEAAGEIGRLGPFRVLRLLGGGGMGVVFHAEDPALSRPVALKVMRPELVATPGARERFLREARAAAAVRHDHVVPVYQVSEDRGVPFLVMPLLEGESLSDRLRREPVLPPAEVARIGRDVALGLAAAHAAGLIHRDLKPANLWLEPTPPRVVILDFGLARPVAPAAPLTRSGEVLGTPHYMAPEQARGGPVDARADLFGLGAVLYQLVTGRPPFAGATVLEVLLALATDEPQSPADVNHATPPALSDLILRLLAKNPAARPGSAAEVAEQLTVISRNGTAPPDRVETPTTAVGVKTPPYVPRTDPWPPARGHRSKGRRPSRRITAALICVGLAGLLGVGLVLGPGGRGVPSGGSDEMSPPGPDPPPPAPVVGEVRADDGRRELVNSLRMRLVRVEPGAFSMGSPESEKDALDEQPRHTVRITRPFFLGRHEVTVGQFRTFITATDHKTDAEKRGGGMARDTDGRPEQRADSSWRDPGFPQGDNHPVVNVSWDDAAAFCRWLGGVEGAEYRLPTEAEWEYACRAGSDSRWSFGDDRAGAVRYANLADKDLKVVYPNWYTTLDRLSDGFAHTAPVGRFRPNAFGLFDLHGNVAEWCRDWYDGGTYTSRERTDPAGSDGVGKRVIRGGSWADSPEGARSAGRYSLDPVSAGDTVGFRVVRVIPP